MRDAPLEIRREVPLGPYATLRAGGPAERFAEARNVHDLAAIAEYAQNRGWPMTLLGSGSNVLPSDRGVAGLVTLNRASRIAVARSGEVLADTGCLLQELFLKTAQAGLEGLSFAVGIPGTLGGALVSNAGAYRSSIGALVSEVEIVSEGRRRWVSPEVLELSYRDSILRRPNPPQMVVLRVRLDLRLGNPEEIYGKAREYQRQRIAKQPPPASAGSFFKNVTDSALAESLPQLPAELKAAGVVPAGFLIEAVGLKGFRRGGAMFGARHANFLLNVGGASAGELRSLAEIAKRAVAERFGVALEEEVLYLGRWEGWDAERSSS